MAPPFLSEVELSHSLSLLAEHSIDQSPEFLRFASAVIAAESGFNRLAQSPTGAQGLMQLTMIGAKEAAKQCNLFRPGGESDIALITMIVSPRSNVKLGTCLLKYYLDQVKGNQALALVLYNGGYVQLTRLKTNGTLSEETLKYVLRVNSLLGRCQ